MSYGKIEIDKKFFNDFANYISATSDAVDKTIKDGSRRAPGWVSQEVMKYYNFKKGDISPTGKGIPKRGANGQVLKDAAGAFLLHFNPMSGSRQDRERMFLDMMRRYESLSKKD